MADLFISGQWCAADGGATRTITCPADGSHVASVDEGNAKRAVWAAREDVSPAS